MHLTHNCLIELHFSLFGLLHSCFSSFVLPFIQIIYLQLILRSQVFAKFLRKTRKSLNLKWEKVSIQIRSCDEKRFLLMIVTWSHPWIYCLHPRLASGYRASESFLQFSFFPFIRLPISRLSIDEVLVYLVPSFRPSWIKKLCLNLRHAYSRCWSFFRSAFCHRPIAEL